MVTLNKKTSRFGSSSDFYRENYLKWRTLKKEQDAPFFMLYKDFEDYLPLITPGALKLYLYYAFKSKNSTGDSWYSVQSISDALKVSNRSIENWNKELESIGLIARVQDAKKSKYTFLRPLSNIVLDLKTEEDLNKMMRVDGFEEVYGQLSGCFHFFQWRKNESKKEKAEYTKPFHMIAVVFTKVYEAPFKNISTIFEIKISSGRSAKLSSAEIKDTIYHFDSEGKFCTFEKNGIVVNSGVNLLDHDVLESLIMQLTDPDVNLDSYQSTELVEVGPDISDELV